MAAGDKEMVTFGLVEVLSGDTGADGTMGSNLTKHGEHLQGTVQIETSDETVNSFRSEEGGVRVSVGQNDAETTATFEVLNPSLAIMAYYMGGEVIDGEGVAPDAYEPPTTGQNINKSFLFKTIAGFDIEIPNGKVVAKPLGGTIGTDAPMTLQVTVTAQSSGDGSEGPIRYVEKEE